MSQTAEPLPGVYLDSCGARYHATFHKKTGWRLQKLPPAGQTALFITPPAFQKPDFNAAVKSQIFTFLSNNHESI